MVAFPLTPAPGYYTTVTPGAAKGVFYVGGTAPFVTLSAANPTTYTVRDYWGNSVSTGSVSGTTVTPTAPVGGWLPGWYRIYFTGGSTDTLFGPAYGSSAFVVMRGPDSRFAAFTTGGTDGSSRNIPAKATLGLGTSRLSITNANAPTTGIETIATTSTAAGLGNTYWTVSSGNAYYDSARTRYQWCNFPQQAFDMLNIGGLHVYCKDGTIDGSTVTVTITTGTSSGFKITVNTETYDNVATAAAAVIALNASAFVRAFVIGTLAVAAGATIGNTYFNGVKSVVTALYALGVTRFEGPSNEPSLSAEVAQQMRLFQAAVHAGNASALAIGPCPVNITATPGSPWDLFLAAGGGAWCDEISFHCYNTITNGDTNMGRVQIAAFQTLLAKYGVGSKPLWQTEATQVMSNVYGVYHPRRSRVPMLQTLLWEQAGVPRERNNVWYDVQHGFWTFPTWWMHSDETLQPYAAMFRVLAEETLGYTHTSALSFGYFADRIFLGSLFTAASGASVVQAMTISDMPSASVTFTVTGSASTLTMSDAFGNLTTLTVTAGKVVMPLADVPHYLRLPSGVTVTVDHVNDWPSASKDIAARHGANNYSVAVAGTITPAFDAIDGAWMTVYGNTVGIASGTTMPDTVTLTWPTATRLDRLLIFCGAVWQNMSTLTDFDVQTSVDGTTWVTQQTVTKTDCTSFQFGANGNGTGCQRETYWGEQYIFDVRLTAPVACKAVRLNVRSTSCGGEPDAACVTTGGQGVAAQFITLAEVVPLCDNNTITHLATIT